MPPERSHNEGAFIIELKAFSARAFWRSGAALAACLLVLLLLAGCAGARRAISGRVVDGQGQPVVGAQVRAGRQSAATLADGAFTLPATARTDALTVAAAGYVEVQVALTPESTPAAPVEVVLQARTLQGVVLASTDGQPVANAELTLGAQQAQTGSDGVFALLAQDEGALQVRCTGCLTRSVESAEWLKAFDATGRVAHPLQVRVEPRQATGRVVSRSDGAPLAGAQVSLGRQAAVADAQGSFGLSWVEPGDTLSVQAKGYQALSATYEGQVALELRLDPWQVAVSVHNQITGQPVTGAQVLLGALTATSDAQGHVMLTPADERQVTVACSGYSTETLTLKGNEDALDIALRPLELLVRLSAPDGKPPVRAAVQVFRKGIAAPDVLSADAAGQASIPDATSVERVFIKAPGYVRVNAPITRTGAITVSLEPFVSKGIYAPFAHLTLPDRIQQYIDLVDRTELNTIVLDVKGDQSNLAWQSENDLARQLNAYLPGVMDLRQVLKMAHDKGIYMIARIVVFKDDYLAAARPDWAIKHADGAPYRDGQESRWVEPYNAEVRAYSVALAREVAEMGFDEIQYDYVRFPSDGRVKDLVYQKENTFDNRVGAIAGFLEETHTALAATPAFLSADIYGMTVWIVDKNCARAPLCDLGIGQWVEEMGAHVDYLSPMLYPSTFAPGNLGYDQPTAHPYEVIYRSMRKAEGRTDALIRPWLQGYSALGITYDLRELLSQMKASEDAGGDGWIFWNAGGKYREEIYGPNAYALVPNLPEKPKE